MSEPMSNHEIEDVLSSIRRLVSEDLRPAARNSAVGAATASPESVTESPQGDKLLLTPALRVVAPVVQEDIVASAAEDDQDPRRSDFAQGDSAVADDDATGAHLAEDVWSSQAEAADWARDDAPSEPENASPVEDVVARLGAAVPSDDAEWESPMGDVDALAESPWPSEPAAQTFAFVHRPRTSDTAPADHSHDIAQDYMDTPSEAFAQADAEDPSDWEDPAPQVAKDTPRRVVTPPGGGERGWADAAEAAVMEDLARDVEAEVGGLFDDGQGGMTFDEEVLRDLVRDIIREELSGTLGERITRNVRKLVRAEIARALAVREFE
jgi:hypothetical protein